MANSGEELRIKPRACIEHFKSTPRDRKTYTTIGYSALVNETTGAEEVRLLYQLDYPPYTIVDRPIQELDDIKEAPDSALVPRFSVLANNVITPEERDDLLDEYYQDN